MVRLLSALVVFLGLTSSTVAALHDRGNGMIYDDVLKITWLANANQGAGSSFDDGSNTTDGLMTFGNAVAWSVGVVHGGFTDWRLPTALNQDGTGPCENFDCTSSELGHMFYNNMGARAGAGILSGANAANLALFTNLQSFLYWSGPVVPNGSAWRFHADSGAQSGFDPFCCELLVWAVRDGDALAVPEPSTYTLMLAGLGLVGAAARMRKRM